MAKTVKYTGTSDVREIYKKDFDSVGVTDQELVRWEQENDFTAEVSDAAAEYLTTKEPDFEIVSTPRSTSGGDDAKRATSGDKK